MTNITLSSGKEIKLYTPSELKAHLDKYVIGQEQAKRTLCTAVYNHYKRVLINIQNSSQLDNTVSQTTTVNIDKSNAILMGSTGSGKTFMVKKLAEFMGVPYYIGDATSITQAGYVGDDVETLIVGLLRATNYDVELAETGIIFIDEIDKLAKRNSTANLTSKDPVGEGVQQALLKIVEGNTVGVPPMGGRKHPEQPLIYVNTNNILFVGSGSFAGIEDIVKDRLSTSGKIGFSITKSDSSDISDSENSFDENQIFDFVSQDDIRKFGFIPEFVGRFPVLANVRPLSKEDLIRIITEPDDNILLQYKTLFDIDKIELSFTDDAIDYIAETAVKLKTGARALRSLFECVLSDYMFELPGTDAISVTVDKDYVISKLDIRYKNIKVE